MMKSSFPFVLILSLCEAVTSFVCLGQHQSGLSTNPIISTTTTLLQHHSDEGKANNEEGVNSLKNLEQARKSFESLVAKPYIFRDSPSSISPPLTTASRRRRKVEMALLELLRDSDDAVNELMDLWMNERGESQAKQMQEMEDSCSDGLVKEEELLRNMIEVNGNEWAEPMSRLAAILFYKGRSVESKEYADIVLQNIKPWHFDCAQLQVMNCLRLGLGKEAYHYARMTLPSLNIKTNNHARKKWVDSALRAARNSYQEAATANQQLGAEGEKESREAENMWQ